MGRQPGAIVIGIGLLGAAAWSIGIGVGVPLARLNRMWPVIVAILGGGMLIQFLFGRRKSPGLLFMGINGLVLGLFLSLFSLKVGGMTWADIAHYWPVIPFTLGAAFLLLYIAGGMRQESLIVPAFLIGGVGLFALPVTLGIVRGQSSGEVLQLWPLLIIFGALIFLFRPPSAHHDGDR